MQTVVDDEYNCSYRGNMYLQIKHRGETIPGSGEKVSVTDL